MAAPPPKSKSIRRTTPPVPPPGGVESVSPSPIFISQRSEDTYLRVDGPESALGSRAGDSPLPISSPAKNSSANTSPEVSSAVYSSNDPETWLTYHATDLISRLSDWADDLSVRESNLNAREAAWERQARRLRLRFQETQRELDELAAHLQEEREELAVQQDRIERIIRDIALASDYRVSRDYRVG